MARNKGHEALELYLEQIQKIVSCVSDEVCFCYQNAGGRHVLALRSGGFFPVVRNDSSVLHVDINQELESPTKENNYQLSTKFYLYSIADEKRDDLVGFHFHPELSDEPIPYPHVHAYAKEDPRFKTLALYRKHIPSGRVILEDVIHWLITELDVAPERADWQDVLASAKRYFKSVKTW